METIKYILLAFGSIVIGFILGNIIVYFFNHMPAKWLTEYGEEPKEELIDGSVRLRSIPYKYVFSGLFICLLLYLSFKGPIYAILVTIVLFIMTLMSLCDIKYMIIPDELCLLLLVSAMGFIPYHGVKDMIFGLLFGVGIGLSIWALSKLLFKKDGIGFGDVKVYGALGFVTGLKGVITIFLLTTLISGLSFLIQVIIKRSSFKDRKALCPYITLSTAIYLIALYNIIDIIILKI